MKYKRVVYSDGHIIELDGVEIVRETKFTRFPNETVVSEILDQSDLNSEEALRPILTTVLLGFETERKSDEEMPEQP